MPSVDDLPPDQRAVLQLLLRQGKSYGDLASLLRISDDAVRERAHHALDGLGPEDGSGLTEHRRDEIGDYLLGQQAASQRAGTRAYLEGSSSARTWARSVATQLRPLAGDDLPEIPADDAEVDEAFGALQARRTAQADQQKSSRLGGVLLLAGLGIAIAVILVIVLSSGGGSDSPSVSTPAASTTTATTTPTSTAAVQALAQVNLVPPGGGSKPLGVASIVSQGTQRALAIGGQDLPRSTPTSFYAVWLYSTPGKAKLLGFAPSVKANGRLQALAAVPADLASYRQIIVTRETTAKPTTPGTIVLAGNLAAN